MASPARVPHTLPAPPRAALRAFACALAVVAAVSVFAPARAQQTNPVDRKVTNPVTDTPNVNPLQQDQPSPAPRTRPAAAAGAQETTEELSVRADRNETSGPDNAKVVVYEGNVDARIGIYRLQADKVSVYEATNKVVAEGNVVFDQGEFQRITGTRAEWNYATKLGFFANSTGFTNQTQDGTIIYFKASLVEKVARDRIVVVNAEVTACDEERPKWSFTSKRATITLNDRVRARNPTFRVKGVPFAYLPYASVSIKPRDRASGFLTPTFSGSGKKGFRISNAYYQTLGRSADVTLRNDIFTGRGIGIGADLRTRANSRSYLNAGFYAIKDRIFGAPASPENPDQGGSSFYAEGVHYFPNGFLAAADINITSNLAFRQIFSDTIQQAISPEERSQLFINKNFGAYSFNFIARTQVTSLPSVRVRTRSLPGISLDKRPGLVGFFKKLPVYFSFESSAEGVSRKETIEDLAAFQAEGATGAIITPSLVQRLDFRPQVSVPLEFGGWTATATGALRATYYSNTLDPATRGVTSRDHVRGYGQFELDLRPPALARNFRRKDGSLRFRHVIEPYLTYRKISGITDFERIIRFDSVEAVANTNEIEFGVVNRFFQRRSTENVSGTVPAGATTAADGADATSQAPLSSQPYEALSITLRQKYFFDQTFGGALIPGRRNQFYPINTFSGFTYGGVPRRFSPLYVEARLRPYRPTSARLRRLSADVRMNFDLLGEGGGLRDLAVTFQIDRRVPGLRIVEAFQTFYYTRAVTLAPSLRQFSDVRGNEPGTLQGSQWSPSLFLGDRDRGLFGGVSLFFDFQNRPDRGNSSLVSSTTTLGYTWDCCAVTLQHFSFDVGLRQENRFVFSFRLNGIGTFGTEQIGHNFR
ncbi:MAG TPA: LPS assembly protein LptD [Pyrinomonadaceae bacterium]|nr:LPS assembly protein LptD [Pyrinomonadaceae bacterium]